MAHSELSRVNPVLVAALTCDTAALDRSSGKKTLVGVFQQIFARRVPVHRPLTVYFKLSDAEGEYDLEVRMVQLRTGRILASGKGTLVVKERLQWWDSFYAFPRVEFPEYDRYEFQVLANGVYLGGSTLDVTHFANEEP